MGIIMPIKNRFLKAIMKVAGALSVLLGILGIFLPLLPSVPFFLIAVACFARSSRKLYDWLLNNRLIGRYIKDYLNGNGVPMHAKISAIMILWLTIGCSILFIVSSPLLKAVLLLVAIGVTAHVIMIRTANKGGVI